MVLGDVDVSNSIQRSLNEVFAFIPELIMAVVIVAVGFLVAKVLAGLVGRALHSAGLDRELGRGTVGQWVAKITSSPSRLIGAVAFWAVFLGAISLAVSVLGINALTDFVAAVYGYLPNVIAALLIFVVAGMVAAGVATLASRVLGGTALGKIVATAGPILVMTIATFMILDQLKIAEDIVVITYAALLGAIALGSALAFGLGGRDVARQMLEGAYQKGQEHKDELHRDVDTGLSRARAEAGVSRSGADGSGRESAYAGASVPREEQTRVAEPDGGPPDGFDTPVRVTGSQTGDASEPPAGRGETRL